MPPLVNLLSSMAPANAMAAVRLLRTLITVDGARDTNTFLPAIPLLVKLLGYDPPAAAPAAAAATAALAAAAAASVLEALLLSKDNTSAAVYADSIAVLGGISFLVQLLGPSRTKQEQYWGAFALVSLSPIGAAIAGRISAAGGITSLVQLLEETSSAEVSSAEASSGGFSMETVQAKAMWALSSIIGDDEDRKPTLDDAVIIPTVVKCLRWTASSEMQRQAASISGRYAAAHDTYRDDIAAEGAIPILQRLLGPGSIAAVKSEAAWALANLALGSPEVRLAVAADCSGVSTIGRLVQLLGVKEVQHHATVALLNLAAHVKDAGAYPAFILSAAVRLQLGRGQVHSGMGYRKACKHQRFQPNRYVNS